MLDSLAIGFSGLFVRLSVYFDDVGLVVNYNRCFQISSLELGSVGFGWTFCFLDLGQ